MMRTFVGAVRAGPSAPFLSTRAITTPRASGHASLLLPSFPRTRVHVSHAPLRHAALCVCSRHASTQSPSSANYSDTPSGAQQREQQQSEKEEQKSGTSEQSQQQQQQKPFSSPFEAYRTYRQNRHQHQTRQYQTFSMYIDRLPPVVREILLYSPLMALLYFVLVQARTYYLDDDERWYMVFVPARWRYATVTPAATSSEKKKVEKMEATKSMSAQPPAHVSSLLKRAPPGEALFQQGSIDEFSFNAKASPSAAGTPNTPPAKERDIIDAFVHRVTNMYLTIKVSQVFAYRAQHLHDASGDPCLVAPFHEVTLRRTEVVLDGDEEDVKRRAAEAKMRRTDKAVLESMRCEYPYGVWAGPLEVLRDPTNGRVVGYATRDLA